MVYLLRIDCGPYTLFVAEQALSIPSDGGDLAFRPGLAEFSWEDSWSLSAAVSQDDLSVQIDGLNGPQLRPYLALGTAEVSRVDLDSGGTWESRERLIRGRISEPQIGANGEPVAFSIRRIDGLASVSDPGPEMVIGSALLDDGSTANQGKTVPTVFGAPGLDLDDGYGGSRALYYIADPSFPTYIIAAHPVVATHVNVSRKLSDANGTPTWVRAEVTIGPVSTVAPSGMGGDAEIIVQWPDVEQQDGSYVGYGARRPDSGSAPLRTAGELIERMLALTGDYDAGRTAAAVELLPYRVDGFYDVAVEPIEWLSSNVLPLFPVSLVRSADGWYPLVWRGWLAGAGSTATHSLSVDLGECSRLGPLVADGSDDRVNEVRIAYGLDPDSREHLLALTVTGDARKVTEPSADPRSPINTAPVARYSYLLCGERTYSRRIESDVVYRPETARQIADWILRRYALPTWTAEYHVHPRHRYRVAIGDVVLLTDLEVGLVDQPVSVEQIVDSAESTTIRIRTIESPGLDRHREETALNPVVPLLVGVTRDALTDFYPYVDDAAFPEDCTVLAMWRGDTANPGTDSTIFSYVDWTSGDRHGISLQVRSNNTIAARVFYGPNTAFSRFSTALTGLWGGSLHRAAFRISGDVFTANHAPEGGTVTTWGDTASGAPDPASAPRFAGFANGNTGSNSWEGALFLAVIESDIGSSAATAWVNGTTTVAEAIEMATSHVLTPAGTDPAALTTGSQLLGAGWGLDDTPDGVATGDTSPALGGLE